MVNYCLISLALTPVTGRCCVRHNGDGEKDGDANHPERDVSAVTEG